MTEQTTQSRIRITFGKIDALRYIGHLDLAKTWERVLRRAQMPLVYSQGFNPQPKMQLASALPLGISSDCELLDIWLTEMVPLETLPNRLNAVSPPGLLTRQVEQVPVKSPALQTILESAEYHIQLTGISDDEVARRVEELLASDEIVRERRGKKYDLRPLVFELRVIGDSALRARLSLGDHGTARPDEVLVTLGVSDNMIRCHREALHLRS
jgi:radical SAM-linked protein